MGAADTLVGDHFVAGIGNLVFQNSGKHLTGDLDLETGQLFDEVVHRWRQSHVREEIRIGQVVVKVVVRLVREFNYQEVTRQWSVPS